jgi:hypothetical protein
MSDNKEQNMTLKQGSPQRVTFRSSVLQSIRQHARSSPEVEICGALIGRLSETGTSVIGAVAGEGASQGSAHVTFTQEAWARIHEEKDRKYSGESIVGWYHSHPGFGVFLSDHDLFIHKHFFSTPGSLAWVYDPHSDEEGCFGWEGSEIIRLEQFSVALDASKDIRHREEPSSLSPNKVASSPLLKALRALFIVGLILIPALLIALGLSILFTSRFPEDAIETLRHSLNRFSHLIRIPLKVDHSRTDPVIDRESKHSSSENVQKANDEKNPRTDRSAK